MWEKGLEATPLEQVREAHTAWLRRVVWTEKLFFFNVKDGWGPLCEILGCEVPTGVDFPRENKQMATVAFMEKQVKRGFIA